MATQLLIVIILAALFFQDCKERMVYWWLFPLLAAMFLLYRWQSGHLPTDIYWQASVSITFLIVQLLLISLYFSLKFRRWVWIMREQIGWGDIWLLLCFCLLFGPLTYIAFYVLTLFFIVLVWMAWQVLFKKGGAQIPFAGLQSFLAIIILAIAWANSIDIFNDLWMIGTLKW